MEDGGHIWPGPAWKCHAFPHHSTCGQANQLVHKTVTITHTNNLPLLVEGKVLRASRHFVYICQEDRLDSLDRSNLRARCRSLSILKPCARRVSKGWAMLAATAECQCLASCANELSPQHSFRSYETWRRALPSIGSCER